MSLFANLGKPSSSAPASGSLFGSAAPASSAPASGGLFGSLGGNTAPASNAPASGGLFGSLGSTTQTSNAPASGGLFANLGAAKSSAPSSGGLFGSLGTSTSAPASGSLFSGLGGAQSSTAPTSTQPAASTGLGGSLFGASTTATNQQQTGQPSLFSTSTAPQQQQQQQQPSGGPLSQSQANASRSAHFDHLLERGRKRNAGEDGLTNFEELPTLQLGLGDIARKVRNLGTGGPSAEKAQDRTAHFLLSASGVKLGSTLRDLNQFSSQAGLSTAGTAANLLDTDVDSYLSNLHSQSTLALIQEGLEQSKRDFDNFLEENVQIEWDAQRKRIYEHFGLGRHEEMAASQSTFARTARGAFGRSTRKGRSMGPGASTNQASFGASQAAPVLGSVNSPYGQSRNGAGQQDKALGGGYGNAPDRFLRERQEKFAGKVRELNVKRQEEQPYPLLQSFYEVERSSEIENQEHFLNAYKALMSITGEAEFRTSNKRAERFFAQDYLDENPNSERSINIRKRILNGSREFLEKKFLQEAMEVIAKQPGEARPGGIPTVINKIKGYIQVKVNFKEFGETEHFEKIGGGEDEFPWVIMFYLLRAGLVKDAAAYVKEKKNFFHNKDRIFAAAMAHYAEDPDRRLTPDLQQKVAHVHAQRNRIAPTSDPYRTACYKIVGRCEMTRRNLESLSQTMDDWVWLQFNLAREGNRAEENAGELFGLDEIRASVDEIGQRHFASSAEASGGYGVYFYLATLAGMFEQAINYLYSYNHTTAVHFAIALAYYGLLRVSDWSKAGSEILTFTQRQQPELNFGRIVGTYTGDFRMARADSATEYLVLICLNADLPGDAGKEQANLCHEALRELVLETREFSTLLGDVKANGHATLGLIQQRLQLIKLEDENQLIKSITQEAARTADDNGRTNDAVLLCHLAGEYDLVVAILNRSLSEALSVDLGQEPLRLEPLKQRLPAPDAQQSQNSDPASAAGSMLGTDDPIELARRIIELYDNNSLWWRSVSRGNRETLGTLFRLCEVRACIERGEYMKALDEISTLSLLPLTARGSLPLIRKSATHFSTLPPEIARNIGNILLWCIMCCSRHREVLLQGSAFVVDATRQRLADELAQMARDLMVFAGLIRYKLPGRVFEVLAREGGVE
ncbi:NIC-domain-containing protein [Westerdykella ornata]|uniref:NIC-domain-containing protein n=1 Tax=Westerdykella ornata TaxID=318751 RepID=A0A6A6JV94_WESOR|nr:NIC-domain-containing protein [Westerdykella ornata]KAF2280307.1 NIC-domain-containing protein [Westerdykella ornata]